MQNYEVGGITGGSDVNELRRKALLDQMGGSASQPAAIAGKVEAAPMAAPPMAPEGPAASQPAKQYKLEGFDAGKLADPTHNTPKYQIARALQGFDPRQGVTPEVLQALNGLGIGQFSGSGDKVQISNGDPRFEGVNSIDLVRGFKDPNSDGGWQFGAEGGVAGGGGPAQGGGGYGLPMNGLLGGDPLAAIQAAIGQYGGESANLQALLRQLGQGA